MDMTESAFAAIVTHEWERVPERFKSQLDNVAVLVEDEPSEEVGERESLGEGETLLGLYQGVPATQRGEGYGIGATVPDTITLYRLPILEEAAEVDHDPRDAVRIVVRETLWHEIGHALGLSEEAIHAREEEGSNRYQEPGAED